MCRLRNRSTITLGVLLLIQVARSTGTTPSSSLLENATSTLVCATVFHRHGARSPLAAYPLDPWSGPNHWPQGFGQLNNVGKGQLHELGTWLRHRYGGTAVLHDRYHPDDVYIRSTDVDRTLMSASVLASALYPPAAGADQWSPAAVGTLWQPIPVHTTRKHLDDVLWMGRSCPRMEHLLAEQDRNEFRRRMAHYPHLVAYLRKHTGYTFNDTTLNYFTAIYDTLTVQAENNLTLPAWSRRVFPHNEALRHLALQPFTRDTRTPALMRLRFGRMFGDVLHLLRERATGRSVPARRTLWLNSAHDSTLTNLLNVIGVFYVSYDS